MKRFREVYPLVLGGAVAGMVLGIVAGALFGIVYDLFAGSVSSGLAGAALAGIVAGTIGAGAGLCAAIRSPSDLDLDRPNSHEVIRIDVQQVSVWDRIDRKPGRSAQEQ